MESVSLLALISEVTDNFLRMGAEAVVKLQTSFNCVQKLKAANLEVAPRDVNAYNYSYYTYELPFDCDKDGKKIATELKKIYDAIGVITVTGRKVPVDGKRNVVLVYLESKQFPGVEIAYQKRLPKDSRCKIVSTRRTGYRREVVCPI